MKTWRILGALGAVAIFASLEELRAGPVGGIAGERGGLEDESGEISAAKYEVPLLQFPAFLDAAATITGARALLRPIHENEFGQSLGAHYWMQDENGWMAAVDSAGSGDWRARTPGTSALAASIRFAALPMSEGAAVPKIAPTTLVEGRLVGQPALFSEAGQPPGILDPAVQMGWFGGGSMGSSGGLSGGLFLVLALCALLFSQLSGIQKSKRRRRSSSRRRRSD